MSRRTLRHGSLAGLFLLALATAASSGGQSVHEPFDAGAGSHERHVARVRGGIAEAFARSLAEYDAHLNAHPDDAIAAVERCTFVSSFLYEEDEALAKAAGDEFDRCLEMLEAGPHADEPLVQVFVLEQRWGPEGITAGEALVSASSSWPPDLRARLHALLAFRYSAEDDGIRAGAHALRAVALDPASDAALMAATQLERQGAKARARSILTAVPQAAWNLYSGQEAALLLLRLGDARGAVDLLRGLAPDGDDTPRFLLARALIADGQVEAARDAYTAALAQAVFPSVEDIRDYFSFERDHGSPDQAAAAYARLREQGFWGDPFGRYRLGLLLAHPSARWTVLDAAAILSLLLALVGFALLPLLVIVPVHYYSLARRSRGVVRPSDPAAPPWGLGHAWYALAAFLVAGLIALYLFAYPDFEAVLGVEPFGAVLSDDRTLARAYLVSLLLVVAVAFPLARGVRWWPLIEGRWPLRRSFGAATILVIFFQVLGTILSAPSATGALGSDTTRAIQGIHAEYGIVVVLLSLAVIVPVVEEIVFRGVLLNGLARHAWFPVAAILQAAVFALLHEGGWPDIPLIFAMGLTTAWLYRRSGALTAPIAFHALNNAFACIGIILATGMLDRGTL